MQVEEDLSELNFNLLQLFLISACRLTPDACRLTTFHPFNPST
jgi:hypothetical protein